MLELTLVGLLRSISAADSYLADFQPSGTRAGNGAPTSSPVSTTGRIDMPSRPDCRDSGPFFFFCPIGGGRELFILRNSAHAPAINPQLPAYL